jgi:hypothetical protein
MLLDVPLQSVPMTDDLLLEERVHDDRRGARVLELPHPVYMAG